PGRPEPLLTVPRTAASTASRNSAAAKGFGSVEKPRGSGCSTGIPEIINTGRFVPPEHEHIYVLLLPLDVHESAMFPLQSLNLASVVENGAGRSAASAHQQSTQPRVPT